MMMQQVRLIVNRLSRLKTSLSGLDPPPSRGGYAYVTPSCEIARPVPVLYPLFRGAIVDAISIGNGFIVGSYQENGKRVLCAYGVNRTLQLGHQSANPRFDKKTWQIEEPVVLLRSGRAHTLGLTESGALFGWGSNNMGQLGISKSTSSSPFSYLNLKGIKDVAAGLDNSFLLTSDGQVLSCGWAADGQTGSGSTQTQDYFSKVAVPESVTKLSSSADSTLVLSSSGQVFGWGNNEYHQISPSAEMQVLTPSIIDLPEPITDIAAGGSFSLFLSTSGKLYSCGYGPGTGLHADKPVPTPTIVPISEKLVSISASLDHAAGVTSEGEVMRWGRGQHSKLISLTDDDIVIPELFEGLKPKVRDVICGPNKTCIITDEPIKSVSRLGMIEGDGDDDEEDF